MNNTKEIITFIHISDLHLISNHESVQALYFRKLLNEVIPSLKPDFVICSGDECNSVGDKNGLSAPILSEWQLYKEMLVDAGYFDPNFWLDIRGNHDAWDESGGYLNYYKDYSVSGQYSKGSIYENIYHYNDGSLRVIGFEGCKEIEWCFFGQIPVTILDELETKLMNKSYSTTLLFSHFPIFTLDCTTKSKYGHNIKEIIELYKPIAYLAGHIHSIMGKHTNYLLNRNTHCFTVNDFKELGMFRVFTLYKGVLSFHDYTINDFDKQPIVCLANPKDYRYLTNTEQSLTISPNDIYIYATSKIEIKHIRLTVDKHELFVQKSDCQSNIYIAHNHILNSKRKHYLSITVSDSCSKRTSFSEYFTTTNQPLSLQLPLNAYILTIDLYKYMNFISTLFPLLFFGIFILSCFLSYSFIPYSNNTNFQYITLSSILYQQYSIPYTIINDILTKWILIHSNSIFKLGIFFCFFCYYFCPLRIKHHNKTQCLYFWWGNYNITNNTCYPLEDNMIWAPICLLMQLSIIDSYYMLLYYNNLFSPLVETIIQSIFLTGSSLLTCIFMRYRHLWEPSDFLCTYTDEIRPFIVVSLLASNSFF